jgi:hypothetical protein
MYRRTYLVQRKKEKEKEIKKINKDIEGIKDQIDKQAKLISSSKDMSENNARISNLESDLKNIKKIIIRKVINK